MTAPDLLAAAAAAALRAAHPLPISASTPAGAERRATSLERLCVVEQAIADGRLDDAIEAASDTRLIAGKYGDPVWVARADLDQALSAARLERARLDHERAATVAAPRSLPEDRDPYIGLQE